VAGGDEDGAAADLDGVAGEPLVIAAQQSQIDRCGGAVAPAVLCENREAQSDSAVSGQPHQRLEPNFLIGCDHQFLFSDRFVAGQ
jgi:hypothetical protein